MARVEKRQKPATVYSTNRQQEAMMKWSTKFIYLAALLFLSGCVAGQSIKMAYEPTSVATEKLGVAVQITADDQRDFVVSGKKQPNYIGHYRAGLGNTWDVTTQNKQPLAENLRKDVSSDLLSLGFDVVNRNAERTLKIVIDDWNFDTYVNGKMWYRIQVSVKSAAGATLAESVLEDTIVIKGSVWVGAKYAFERELPKIYQSIVSKIARDNQPILSALKSE